MLTYVEENVTKIRWSQWSQSEAQDAPDVVVFELRQNHAHAMHEVETRNIWLFDFSASSNDDFNEILDSHEYSGRSTFQASFSQALIQQKCHEDV